MEPFANESKIRVNVEIGRWLSLAGLGVLIVGMVISVTKPELVIISLACLVLGFLASTIGAYYGNRWTRSPRADEALNQALKGTSNKYHMYHYLLPLPHVLLGPAGLFLFRVYLHEGQVTYDGKKWKQKFNLLRFLGFSGQDTLADPVRDAQYDAQRFYTWLKKRLPETEIPTITPVIVFIRDGAELDVAETDVPVLQRKQLKGWIRNKLKELPELLDEDALYHIERTILGDKVDEL
ncbi:MAG: hypothetical protein JXA89_27795 [Anaerolineae bacterium]|nr:hypothetical protein [Anaerolineae bacterium]